MGVPENIEQLAVSALEQMRTHPQHHFDWRARRELYHQSKIIAPEQVRQILGRLAIVTAEHVLPIFTAAFPTKRLPHHLVRYARKLVQGTIAVTAPRLDVLEHLAYHDLGIDCLELRGPAYNAEYAGTAAYKALLQARKGRHLLDRVETLRRCDDGGMLMGGGTASPEFDHLQHGSTFTDADFAHLVAYGDTAGAAAIAYACEQERFQLHGDRLREFWEWWVAVALPEAWQRV